MIRPKTLAEINPSGLRHFGKRKCAHCRGSIMAHWVLNFLDTELRSRWYCKRDGTSYTWGMSNGQ